jgi:superfamily I DNA/RNA helicase
VDRALHWSVQQKCSLWQALRSPELMAEFSSRTVASIKAFVELIDGYETKLCEPLVDPAAVVTQLIKEVDYASELRRSCKSAEEANARETNMHDMLRDLAQFNERSTKGLRGFLDEIVLDQEREEDKKEDIEKKRGVTLITMHAAKGLEFSHVYLIGSRKACCRTIARRPKARSTKSGGCFTSASRAHAGR